MSKEKTGIYLDAIIAPTDLNEEDKRKVQLMVAERSLGVDDCVELLNMLGLNFRIDK